MAIPYEPLLTLSPSAYSLATRHRLGLHPSDYIYMPSRCACGADPRLSHSHAHACPKIRRRAANVRIRHGLIEQCVEFCGSEAGCLILTEDHTRRSEWPDQRIFFPPDPAWFSTDLVLSDVSVACPTAPSHIPNAQLSNCTWAMLLTFALALSLTSTVPWRRSWVPWSSPLP